VRHSRKAFNTDTGISKKQAAGGPRELVAWNDDSSLDLDGDLEDFQTNSGTASWDQFETAKKMWGFESTYDENLYTTRLDKSSPVYRAKAAEAERIAAEIMESQTSNPHVAEERGQESEVLKKMDDADRYTDVLRDGTDVKEAVAASLSTPAAAPPTTEAPKLAAPTSAKTDTKKLSLRADAADFNPFEMSFVPSVKAPAPYLPAQTTPALMMPPYSHPNPTSLYGGMATPPMYYPGPPSPMYFGSPAPVTTYPPPPHIPSAYPPPPTSPSYHRMN
jgi:hypothetical protein